MYVAEFTASGVRGFAGARSVNLRFTRPDGTHAGWTVLAGRNGSGKTTLLRALALTLAGPNTARSLVSSFDGWITNDHTEAHTEAKITFDSGWNIFVDVDIPLKNDFQASLIWKREPPNEPFSLALSNEPIRHSTQPNLKGSSTMGKHGPWADNPLGWFCAGYGPFRRLVGGASDAQRLMLGSGNISRLASLFHEDASLAESVSWLVDLHLRRLENRPEAEELLEFVITLLNDGLLPDGFTVDRVDSEGLWAHRDGHVIALRELSDGYRTVTALVLDLVRHLYQIYGHLIWEAPGNRPPVSDPFPRTRAPGVVFIDEIDAHLHVSWQKRIGEWLKSHFPGIQFIVSSHSPYICQSADPGGLIRLPGLGEQRPPEVVDNELYERVVYGSGDDALLTELFGVDSPYSSKAEELRRRLTTLERAVLRGQATEAEAAEYEQLRDQLTSSLTARVDEVSARIT